MLCVPVCPLSLAVSKGQVVAGVRSLTTAGVAEGGGDTFKASLENTAGVWPVDETSEPFTFLALLRVVRGMVRG
jgi:hypothetical protein